MSNAWARVTITERSCMSTGWKGSMASFMPSSAMTLAASRSLPGAGPQTRTSTSVPRAAASSTARRLSSRRARRSAVATAGNIPPRQTLETRSPASRTTRALSDSPVSETLSRHSPINPMPARAQPSAASRTLQLFVVFWLRLRRDGSGGEGLGLTLRHPGNREHAAHTFGGEIWVVQKPGPVCEDEQLREVCHRACALLSPDHSKVVLVAVYVGQEDDASLVVAGRGLEDVAAQGDGGREYLLVAVCIPGVEHLQGYRGCGCDGVEDAEEGVGEAFFIALDQVRVVEVVARVHPDAIREAAAYVDLAARVEEGDFDAVDLLGVVVDDGEAYFRGGVEIAVAPVTTQGRVELLAEPVDDDG